MRHSMAKGTGCRGLVRACCKPQLPYPVLQRIKAALHAVYFLVSLCSLRAASSPW